jgi:sigma-B regulation protein RsbU (phosphoserine phosphatase)
LHAVLEKYKNSDTKTVCEEVKRDVDAFVGEAPQFDDITMLCLEYKATTERNAEDTHCGDHA